MRRTRSRTGDDDVVDVLVDEREDAPDDEFLTLLHELALEAIQRRALSPGDRRAEPLQPPAPELSGLACRFWAHRHLRWVAIVIVAVGLVAVPNLLEARQEAALRAALAAQPAVLHDAEAPLTAAWRAQGRMLTGASQALLVVDRTRLRRLDPATGREVWRAPSSVGAVASEGHCVLAADDGAVRPSGSGATEGYLACFTERRPVRGPGATTARVRVVAVDVATGATRLDVAVAGALITVDPLGADLLVAIALADGHLKATRWDLAAGVPRWDYLSGARVLTGGASVGQGSERRPDSLTVGEVALDLTTGDELDAEQVRGEATGVEEWALPDGFQVSWAWAADGRSGRGLVTRDGVRQLALIGPPVVPAVTDGSHPRTLLTASADGSRLRALDVRTGRVRWSVPSPAGLRPGALALADDVVLLDGAAMLTALEVRTGERRWIAPVVSSATTVAAVTDAGTAVLLMPTADGGVWVSARHLADGSEVWGMPAPPGTSGVAVVDHRLLAVSADAVVGLVPQAATPGA